MNIGIIGAGMIGGTLGALWAGSGHRILLSSRHPENLETIARKIGKNASHGTVEQAAAYGDVLLLAVPMGRVIELSTSLKGATEGRILIDATNFFESRDRPIAEKLKKFPGAHSAFTASLFPGARLVKAFNTIHYKSLLTQSRREGTWIAVPVAGNDASAKDTAGNLVRDAGFEPCDAGTLDDSVVMQPENLLWLMELPVAEMRKLLDKRGERK